MRLLCPDVLPAWKPLGLWGIGKFPSLISHCEFFPNTAANRALLGDYHSGAPELIVEVAVSSRSRDFGAKKRLYEKMGVREYLIVVPREQDCVGFSLTSGSFQKIKMKQDAVFRSIQFPGLWLDLQSIWQSDLPRMFATLQQGLATPEHAAYAAQLASQKR